MCARHAAAGFGAAQGGSAAEPTLGGFCQLVRIVRPHRSCSVPLAALLFSNAVPGNIIRFSNRPNFSSFS